MPTIGSGFGPVQAQKLGVGTGIGVLLVLGFVDVGGLLLLWGVLLLGFVDVGGMLLWGMLLLVKTGPGTVLEEEGTGDGDFEEEETGRGP
jgi:hypothetical protein